MKVEAKAEPAEVDESVAAEPVVGLVETEAEAGAESGMPFVGLFGPATALDVEAGVVPEVEAVVEAESGTGFAHTVVELTIPAELAVED